MTPQPQPFTPASAHPFESPLSGGETLLDILGAPAPPVASAPPAIVPFTPAGDFLSRYGLHENPFADCVHPAVYFRTDSHADAFRRMVLAVDFRVSLGMVTGPSGTGKTLVSQLLLQHFGEPRHRVVLVLVTPGLSKTGLLREILSELDLALPAGIARVQDLMKLLANHIIEMHGQGQRLIIIVDECHLLCADCLHVIRTISNIETPQEKLVTCLLFGESRLADRLTHSSYASLNNRIYMRGALQPLTGAEIAQYMNFRVLTAGRLDPLFTELAFAALHEITGGVCRSVNKLAMLSLIEAADCGAALVDESHVRAAAEHM